MILGATLEVDGASYQTSINEDDGDRQYTTGQIWVCTGCGVSFARLRVTDPIGRARPYQPLSGRCRSCPPHFGFVPGSIWLSWDKAFLASLPLPILYRELLLHIEHYERKYNV